MIVLGIETSCDETAAAVVANGRRILSSVVSSQVAVHRPFGGVVPELASRKHIEAIVPVVRQALSEGGISQAGLEAVAVTQGPGLIGSLLVGFSFAKAFAMVRGLPWIGVSHLEGHINSVFLEPDPPAFPFTALLASGGHTSIYQVTSHTQFDLMGQTRDDAAGEAFDKVAKMLGLGYPGGGIISKLAQEGDPTRIAFPRAYLDRSSYDFSFSGLKTAVGRYVRDHSRDLAPRIPDIAAGFQEAVVDVLADKVIEAAIYKNCSRIALVGGVAANGRLREKVTVDARKKGISVYLPGHDLCGDNAAMIAAAGYHHLANGARSDFDDDVYSRQAL
ncbi:MAG: tRNA (adenosine(37)-N6)-threonylcarbamoyltransferase complex transferase subunit TsaD [Desulfobacterales bacterium]|jgi:N6-L-threonylcarbamoyladenine synthase